METGWVKLYFVEDAERIETLKGPDPNGKMVPGPQWVEQERARLEALGRRVDLKHSRALKGTTLSVYVPEPMHIERRDLPNAQCWCGYRHRPEVASDRAVTAA